MLLLKLYIKHKVIIVRVNCMESREKKRVQWMDRLIIGTGNIPYTTPINDTLLHDIISFRTREVGRAGLFTSFCLTVLQLKDT